MKNPQNGAPVLTSTTARLRDATTSMNNQEVTRPPRPMDLRRVMDEFPVVRDAYLRSVALRHTTEETLLYIILSMTEQDSKKENPGDNIQIL